MGRAFGIHGLHAFPCSPALMDQVPQTLYIYQSPLTWEQKLTIMHILQCVVLGFALM